MAVTINSEVEAVNYIADLIKDKTGQDTTPLVFSDEAEGSSGVVKTLIKVSVDNSIDTENNSNIGWEVKKALSNILSKTGGAIFYHSSYINENKSGGARTFVLMVRTNPDASDCELIYKKEN